MVTDLDLFSLSINTYLPRLCAQIVANIWGYTDVGGMVPALFELTEGWESQIQKRCHGRIRSISLRCDKSSERGRQGAGHAEKGPSTRGRLPKGHKVQGETQKNEKVEFTI